MIRHSLPLFFSLIFLLPATLFSWKKETSQLSVNAKAPTTFRCLTFNIEDGGTQIDFNQVIHVIRKSHADVVSLQESWGNLERIASALGWHYISRKQHIISRFPIYTDKDAGNTYVLIKVKQHSFIALSNLHLPDDGYGPESLQQGMTIAAVMEKEKSARLPEALPAATALSTLASLGIPAVITGDFNSPSSLDWIPGTQKNLKHHHTSLRWPVTQMLAQHGFKDAYREMFPDPIQKPGCTWPAFRPLIKNSVDGYNPSSNDLPDRIDFIFYAGPVHITAVDLLGEAHAQDVTQSFTPWPSDHRALCATIQLQSHAHDKYLTTSALKQLTRIPAYDEERKRHQYNKKRSRITVSSPTIKSGEPFEITWQGALGYRYDYIHIAPAGSEHLGWGEATRLYTHARTHGAILVDAKNIKGNWTRWCEFAAGQWPLSAGRYIIQLMLDDSDTSLAKTYLTVID